MKSVAENCAEWMRVNERNKRLSLGTATESDYAELIAWLAAPRREAVPPTNGKAA
jgi:hypothetical protein